MVITILTAIWIYIISPLGASFVFVYLMYRQRPKLELSQQIAKTIIGDNTVYAFKVINAGRRDANSVMAELFLIQPHVVEGGTGYNIMELDLVRNNLFQMRPLKKVGDRFGAVFEFITTEDLEAEWDGFKDSYLLFRVSAQDSISQFTKVFTTEFESPAEAIIVGRFAKGARMEITN
jgi:hypothetical protein